MGLASPPGWMALSQARPHTHQGARHPGAGVGPAPSHGPGRQAARKDSQGSRLLQAFPGHLLVPWHPAWETERK